VFQMQSDIATRVAESLGVILGAAETKRLAEKPTQNLAAYDALLKGEEASNAMAYTDPASMRSALKFYERAVALDPSLAKGWARVSSANTLLYANSAPTPELSERARAAAEKTIALAPDAPEGYGALGSYHRLVLNDFRGALEQYEQGRRRAPGSGPLLAATALAEQGLGKWEYAVEHLRQAERLDPRSVAIKRILGMSLLRMRLYPEARAALDRALALAPTNLDAIQYKAMTFVAEGNEPAARAVFAEAAKTVDATALVAYFANYWGLGWLLDEHHRQLLLRLTPSAFDDDRAQWAIVLAQACALSGDQSGARTYAEEARKALEEQLRSVPQDADRHVSLGIALAILGRKEDAVREGKRGVALDPIAKDAYGGPWVQQEFGRLLLLVGEPEKALDQLEPLLRISCVLSPGWLAVDPNFAPLRSNPRFQKLVASRK
jgi:tetratricopeptide (TPR) repeat protein